MDGAKQALLFGAVPAWADPDDPDDRATLLADELADTAEGPLHAFQVKLYETVAAQIVDDAPPVVWATAQRLLGMRIDRRQVLRNLVLALDAQLQAALGNEGVAAVDPACYAAVDEAEALTMTQLGLPRDEEPYVTLLDPVCDRAIDAGGPLVMLAGDLVVEPASLCAGIVLTHRPTEAEQPIDTLDVSVDLVGSPARRSRCGPGRAPARSSNPCRARAATGGGPAPWGSATVSPSPAPILVGNVRGKPTTSRRDQRRWA